MQVLTATVKSQPREVTTKFGQRAVMDIVLPNGQEQAIWGPANFPAIMNCRNGQSVPIALDSKGKYHVVEGSQQTAPTIPATGNIPTQPQGMSPDTKKAIAAYVEEQASLFNYCYQTAAQKVQGLPPEQTREVATTLFIQASRHFGL
jgi:hypothetical protein